MSEAQLMKEINEMREISFDFLPRLKTRESHGTAPLSWDITVRGSRPVLVGRNSPHYGRTGEPLAVPTSRYPYHRHPWRDSGVPFAEYSPHHSRPRSQPCRTPRTRTVRVQRADCRPCDRTPNTTSTYRVPTPTPRRCLRLPPCSQVAS